MSLGERLDIDLGEPDTDKRNPDGITRCQSMMVNEDQHHETWAKIRETSSVLVTVCAHNGLSRVQGKTSFNRVI